MPFAKTKTKALNEIFQAFDLSRSFFYVRISQGTNFSEKIWNCFQGNYMNIQLLLVYKDCIIHVTVNMQNLVNVDIRR